MKRIRNFFYQKDDTERLLLGKVLANLNKDKTYRGNLGDFEFSVFSQWGDDGIIQFLVQNIELKNEYFVEFGVENYMESNTRFLLMNNNWTGLVMDGSDENINFIKEDTIYWKYDIQAKKAFITMENINELLSEKHVPTQIGLLHIDIDGNDYWIWKAINTIDADIVVMEYNSIFGSHRAITIPYTSDFVRSKAHYSHLYAGSSLLSLCDLADTKGYYFVGSNSAGNNAYFVKKEKIGKLKKLTAQEGYVESKFRESRNEKGKLDFVQGKKRFEIIKHLPFFNTRTNSIETYS